LVVMEAFGSNLI